VVSGLSAAVRFPLSLSLLSLSLHLYNADDSFVLARSRPSLPPIEAQQQQQQSQHSQELSPLRRIRTPREHTPNSGALVRILHAIVVNV
jgi:hypothetical protein